MHSHETVSGPAALVRSDERASGPASGGAALDALVAVLRACAPETHAHGRRVARVSAAVAATMGLPDVLVEQVAQAALLHDIGKLALSGPDLGPDLGPDGPDDELGALLRRHHVRAGFDILSAVPHLRPAAALVVAVHERWDGYGYPAGLQGTEIPLGARVIAVADAHDTLTAHHMLRDGMSEAEASAEVVRGAGTYFDPGVVHAWLRVRDRFACC
jgi:response regulator RpfG family c-di-GMP phosphodiesterase